MKPLTIEIPVIVGSNGKWIAHGYDCMRDPDEDVDWGFMSEHLDSSGPNDKDPIWPAAEKRFVVRATVYVPDDTPDVVSGEASERGGGE